MDLKFIPGVVSYQIMYRMVTQEQPNSRKRVPVTVTTREVIKFEYSSRPGSKISGKFYIRGEELIKFLKIHNLI